MHTPKPDAAYAPPAHPRLWLAMVRDILGINYMANLFGVNGRTVTRWIAQRPYVSEDSIRENPLEHFETLLCRLMGDGYHDIARVIVARHADLTGCRLTKYDPAKPDKTLMEAEMLDDYPALVKFHDAIQKGKCLDNVRYFAQKATEQIEETLELYRSKVNAEEEGKRNE
jgi:hypothetical protein